MPADPLPSGYSLVLGVKEGWREAPWAVAGGGGGIAGGVERACVFTSAGESGMVPAALSALSARGTGHGVVSGVCQAGVRGRGATWGPWVGLDISAPQLEEQDSGVLCATGWWGG